jgi:hypothetical protein
MSKYQTVTTTRDLEEFRFLELCDSANFVDLVITSGGKESLTITGPAKMVSRIETEVNQDTLVISLGGGLIAKILDALTTSLSRRKVIYELTVRQLDAVDLCGLIRVDTRGIETAKPIIRRIGPPAIPVRISIPFG